MAERKLGQGVRGVLRKTFGGRKEAKKSLSNSSSPMEKESESPARSSRPSSTMRSDPAVRLGTSLTFNDSESVSYAASSGSIVAEPIKANNLIYKSPYLSNGNGKPVGADDAKKERHRECSLVIHFGIYGNADQAEQVSRNMLRTFEMRGTRILHATHNGQPVEPAESS